MNGNGTAKFNFHQQRRINQKIRADNVSRHTLLSGGVPTSLSRSKSGQRKSTDGTKKSLRGGSLSRLSLSANGNTSSFLNHTITNIRVIKKNANQTKKMLVPPAASKSFDKKSTASAISKKKLSGYNVVR